MKSAREHLAVHFIIMFQKTNFRNICPGLIVVGFSCDEYA